MSLPRIPSAHPRLLRCTSPNKQTSPRMARHPSAAKSEPLVKTSRSRLTSAACKSEPPPTLSRAKNHNANRIYKPKHTKMEGTKRSIDRLSLFLSRVAEEAGDGFSAATDKATAKLCRVYYRLIEYMSAMDSRMSQTFNSMRMPSIKQGSLEHITSSEYKCRMFMRRIYHPSSCVMISGSRCGLPHGHVIVKRNPNLTFEQQQILRDENNEILDKNGFISPKKLLHWLTPAMVKAVQELVSWDMMHPADDSSRHGYRDFVGVKVQITSCNTVKLLIPCNKDEIVSYSDQYEDDPKPPMLTMVFIPTLRGHWNWPMGTHLQHAYPKTQPYGMKGQSYIKSIDELQMDGDSLFLLEPCCKTTILHHPLVQSKFSGVPWTVSFYPVNIILYKSLFDLKLSWNIENAISIMRTLRRAHSWDKLTKQVIMTCILWTMKKKLMHVRNLADFILKLLDSIRIVAQQRFCPCFLMPNVNVLKDLKPHDSRRISTDIALLQSRILADPSKVLTYIGYRPTSS